MSMEIEPNRAQTCCFTGHRKLRRGDRAEVVRKLDALIPTLIEKGYRFFCTGGARGFDTLAAEAVLSAKKEAPHIHLILVLPFENQYQYEKGWADSEIAFYHEARDRASSLIHLSPVYQAGIYYTRDRYLIDHSVLCVAYQYKNAGGTAYTVNYAKKAGVPVLYVI